MSDDPWATPPDPGIGSALRERMQEAVARVEPRDGTLEFLHRAVSARRKQRRTAFATSAMMLVAVAAGVVVAGRDLVRGGNGVSASLGVQGPRPERGASAAGQAGSGRSLQGIRATTSDSPQLAYPVTSATSVWADVTAPGSAPAATSTAAGPAAVLPVCQRSSLSAVQTMPDPTVEGIVYDTVTATVRTACRVSGPPRLYVYDPSGTLSADVLVYRADPTLSPGLPQTDTWGRTLILGPGDTYSFEVAWAPAVVPCGAPTSGSAPTKPDDPSTAASTTDGVPPLSALASMTPSSTATGRPGRLAKAPKYDYTLAYAVNGVPTRAMIPLVAGCGSAVYVTDIYENSDVPQVQPTGSPSPS